MKIFYKKLLIFKNISIISGTLQDVRGETGVTGKRKRFTMFMRKKRITIMYAFMFMAFSSRTQAKEICIVGGGIAGIMEAYYTFIDAKFHSIACPKITILEKNKSLNTTVTHIVPSLTPDEILSVVPRGAELTKKLEILFSEPGGICVNDVRNIHKTKVTELFQQSVHRYSQDEMGHAARTKSLLELGKMSMDLWQNMYDTADAELREILETSNFNPCRNLVDVHHSRLHEGYRIDLIYNIPNAQVRAEGMKLDYETLGYTQCKILSPNEVVALDPFLKYFCESHSVDNVWNNDTTALWRPGGCIDTQVFLPKFYAYIQKAMKNYSNSRAEQDDNFHVLYGKEVIELLFARNAQGNTIVTGLICKDGQIVFSEDDDFECVLCPGESVGTLKNLGLSEPAYAGFAGVSLLLDIEVPQDKIDQYKNFNHCMEVHQEGVVLAWQARFRNNKIFIGVAGTKAFYSDQRPNKNQEFAKNRNLLQLNMVNNVLPEFISLALNHDTKGKTLTDQDLSYLESRKIATRWAGIRAVVYDGFPSLGFVYKDGAKVVNTRCTNHLGSGGVSFSHAAVVISRRALDQEQDSFTKCVLAYGDSSRTV